MIQFPGKYAFKLEVYPFTVRGLDSVQDFAFEAKASSDARKKKIKDLETKEKKLKIEPSLFQQMLANIVPVQDRDDEEEESDDEEESKRNKEESKEPCCDHGDGLHNHDPEDMDKTSLKNTKKKKKID